jgi:hypothetical protein
MRSPKTFSCLLLTTFFLVLIPAQSVAAACSTGQLSTIRSAQNSLNMKQSTLSRAQADLAKVNQKLNTLQQQMNRYTSMKNGSPFIASTQRQIDSALREQGQVMQKVSTAQTFYNMSLNSYNSAASRCTP